MVEKLPKNAQICIYRGDTDLSYQLVCTYYLHNPSI